MTRRAFLTARWRYLAMLNYEVDPALLTARVPDGVELDFHDGKTYVSVVGFRFESVRLAGLPVPFHTNFEEVNLRYYVRRREGETVKRGVVFLREMVPRWAIARMARLAYNEQYVALPMSHKIDVTAERGGSAEYSWIAAGETNRLAVQVQGAPQPLVDGSLEQFITEHYWGYAAQRDGGTLEYQVAHPPWRVWKAQGAQLEANAEHLYGPEFAETLAKGPNSALLADGSPVVVYRPRRL